jgi:hypothetical protein
VWAVSYPDCLQDLPDGVLHFIVDLSVRFAQHLNQGRKRYYSGKDHMPTTCKICRTESCVLLLDLSVRFAQHLNQGRAYTSSIPTQFEINEHYPLCPGAGGSPSFLSGFKCSLRSTLKQGRQRFAMDRTTRAITDELSHRHSLQSRRAEHIYP